MDHYDTAWKSVFDLPLMVEHLLLGFLPRVAALLDLATLRMLSPQAVAPGQRRLEGDMLWRAEYADGSGRSLVLVVEFQSAPDADMASRAMGYEAAAVERLRRHADADADRSVRTLAVVLHTGGGRWTASGAARPEDVLVEADGEVSLPTPSRYVVVDATAPRPRRDPASRNLRSGGAAVDAAAPVGDDAPQRNLAGTLFALNAAEEVEDMEAPMLAMAGWLNEAVAASAARGSAEDAARGLLEWLRALAPRMIADAGEKVAAMVEKLTNALLRKERKMTLLAERVQKWETGWLNEGIARGMARGLAQGREQGREQGLEQGREQEREQALARYRESLAWQAERKFGGDAAAALAARLADVGDFDRLRQVGGWIIDCRTGAELLRRLG